MTQKTCIRCKVPKNLDDFCKDLSRPDGKHPVCKDCQKINRKVKGHGSSQAHNKRIYKATKIKDNYIHHKCLGYNDDGKPCQRKPKKGYFCPKCEIRRRYILEYCEEGF